MADANGLGPLAALVGTWEGDAGVDVAPAPDRTPQETRYRERLVLEAIGEVDNHEQRLQALRYATTAWPEGEADPFHEEVGYWLWDPQAQQVMRCFLVPRGVSVLAGGTVAADATRFELAAEVGEPVFGICSNPFLHSAFRTVRYEVEIEVLPDGRFRYREDTVMRMPGREELFHHTDQNTLARIG